MIGLTFLSCKPLFAQRHLLPVLHFQRLEGRRDLITSTAVVRDPSGFVWYGTQYGLQRSDGYSTREYTSSSNDTNSLPSNDITSILIDSKERFWAGSSPKGLSLFDRNRDQFFNFSAIREDSTLPQTATIRTMMEDRRGDIWLATSGAGVVHLKMPRNGATEDYANLVRSIRFQRIALGTRSETAYAISERHDGNILVASDSGLILLNPQTFLLDRLHLRNSSGGLLDSVRVSHLVQEPGGVLWAGTREGLFRINWESGEVSHFKHHKNDSLSIRGNDILDLARDRDGSLWIATVKGLDLFSPSRGQRIPFIPFDDFPATNTLATVDVDGTGTVWIACNYRIYYLSPRSRRFPHFSLWSLSGIRKGFQQWLQSFQSIERSSDGSFWFLSDGDLFSIDIRSGRVLKSIEVFRDNVATAEASDRASTLLDRNGNFWYAAGSRGLYKVNLSSGRVSHYLYRSRFYEPSYVFGIAQGPGDTMLAGCGPEGLMKCVPASRALLRIANTPYAYRLMKDRLGKIWIVSNGLSIYDPITGASEHHVHSQTDTHSLSDYSIGLTFEDPQGRVWVGGSEAVNLWDPLTKSFTRYVNTSSEDHPGGTPSAGDPLGSDSRGRIWIRTVIGLRILDPSTGVFTSFDYTEGICGYPSDMEVLDDGKILLSGWGGLNIVSPDSIDARRPPPPLLLTRLTINDNPVAPPVLQNRSGSLELSYTQNVIEFEFAAVEIDALPLVRYQYRLEGLENDWVKPVNRRFVRYPGLPTGNYVFKVRAASAWKEWPDQDISIAISIAPPWWLTPWAKFLYGSLCIAFLFGAYRLRLRQVHLKQQAEMEHFQAVHLAEVDRLKSRFFANISHEFRTPLTLILGPLEKMLSRNHDASIASELGMMERNARRLLRLIGQLLDLSKLEAGAMKLRASRMNVVPLIKGIARSFDSSAGMRGITLDVEAVEDDIELYCDQDMIEKIVTNLLSNAFKFTREGGSVSVALRTEQSGPNPAGAIASSSRKSGIPRVDNVSEWLSISVSDTGIGIPADQLDKVFDRFYQVDASQTREYEGSGLGLALVKELVDLHRGTIQVQSEVGRGTTFVVRLALGRSHLRDEEIVSRDSPSLSSQATEVTEAISTVHETSVEPSGVAGNAAGPTVLIIEDSADVRAYIRSYLVPAYQVTEACDGAQGIETALETIPDLIISDVMMPKKDGYEVCKTLKRDEKTSHIPIILLTAKAATENKIQGLEIGADDYLIKPFEPKELLARVHNLIEVRTKLRQKFNARVPLRPGEIAVSSVDDAFLKKAAAVVEKRMSDDHFSVDDLGHEVGMSRSQLHRKLTALTGMSSGDFIRYLRLHRAMDLLRQNAATVSEIAYLVGFSSPAYFTKCFHEQFATTPSEVRGTAQQKPS